MLEEVNNNEIPMEPYLAVSTIVDQLSPMAAAGEAPGWKAEYEPQACEQSIEHILTRKLLDGREGNYLVVHDFSLMVCISCEAAFVTELARIAFATWDS